MKIMDIMKLFRLMGECLFKTILDLITKDLLYKFYIKDFVYIYIISLIRILANLFAK